MIDPAEFLLSLANIAVSLAGFSGLIVGSVLLGALLVLMATIGRVLTRRGYPRRVPFFPTAMVALLSVGLTAVAAVAFGAVPPARVHGVYSGGLIALLLVASLALAVFLVLLARAIGTHDDARRVTMASAAQAADEHANRGD